MVRAASERHRTVRSELLAVAPPYRMAVPVHGAGGRAELPLGSVVLAQGDATLAALADLTALSHRAPWIVPSLALSTPQESLEPLLLVTELRDRLVVSSPARGNDDVAHVVAAVRRRRPPTPAMLARWVARRLSTRELESPLRHQFERSLGGAAADGDRSVASYSRLFSRYGSYTARDWRALARLCAHVISRTSEDGESEGNHGKHLPFRTASHYAERYLGVRYHVTAERLGWEWVLEAALRTGGYVKNERGEQRGPPSLCDPSHTR